MRAQWLEEVRRTFGEDMPCVLVGSKLDKLAEMDGVRQVCFQPLLFLCSVLCLFVALAGVD
jgi:hypothetical protein